MKKIIPLVFLLSCGTRTEEVTTIEPEDSKTRIRELNFQSVSDGTSVTREQLPLCDRNCKLWLVEQPQEDLYFCHRKGEGWLQLSEYVGPEDTMYCSL